MAKRKKHRKKQHNHKQNVAKNTTPVQKTLDNSVQPEPSRPNVAEKIEAQATQSAIMGDVRYSLVLMVLIIAVFAVIYIALQNQSVSNSVYGVFKLNSISL